MAGWHSLSKPLHETTMKIEIAQVQCMIDHQIDDYQARSKASTNHNDQLAYQEAILALTTLLLNLLRLV